MFPTGKLGRDGFRSYFTRQLPAMFWNECDRRTHRIDPYWGKGDGGRGGGGPSSQRKGAQKVMWPFPNSPASPKLYREKRKNSGWRENQYFMSIRQLDTPTCRNKGTMLEQIQTAHAQGKKGKNAFFVVLCIPPINVDMRERGKIYTQKINKKMTLSQ